MAGYKWIWLSLTTCLIMHVIIVLPMLTGAQNIEHGQGGNMDSSTQFQLFNYEYFMCLYGTASGPVTLMACNSTSSFQITFSMGTGYLQNQKIYLQNRLALTVVEMGQSVAAEVTAAADTNSDLQQWKIIRGDYEHMFQIQNPYTRLCLAVVCCNGPNSINVLGGIFLAMIDCATDEREQTYLYWSAGFPKAFTAALWSFPSYTCLRLDAENTSLTFASCDSGDGLTVEYESSILLNMAGYITWYGTGICLTANTCASSNENLIYGSPCDGSLSQKWLISVREADGDWLEEFQIRTAVNNNCMTLTTNGAVVELPCGSDPSQLWGL